MKIVKVSSNEFIVTVNQGGEGASKEYALEAKESALEAEQAVTDAEAQVTLAQQAVTDAQGQVSLAAAQVGLAEAQVTLATAQANDSSQSAAESLASKNEASQILTEVEEQAVIVTNRAGEAEKAATLASSAFTYLLENVGKNTFNKDDVVANQYVGYSSPNLYSGILTATGWFTSNFIPVFESTTYTLSGLVGTSTKRIMFYDYLKNPIGTTVVDVAPQPKTFTTPVGCLFVLFTVNTPAQTLSVEVDGIQLELGTSATTFSPYLKKPVINSNIVFLGDSITAMAEPKSYVANILKRITFRNSYNLSRSGATLTNTVDTVYDITSTGGSTTPENVIWNQLNKLIAGVSNNTYQTPDCVIISAGTNDLSRPLGTFSAAFSGAIVNNDANTILDVHSAVRYISEKLLLAFPLCQIIFMTPLQRGQADNTAIYNIGDAIDLCSNRLTTQTIRQDRDSGIYGYNEIGADIFLYDNLHLNEAGALKVGKWLSSQLKYLINTP